MIKKVLSLVLLLMSGRHRCRANETVADPNANSHVSSGKDHADSAPHQLKGGRQSAGIHFASDRRKTYKLNDFKGQKKRSAGDLRLGLYRWLNERNEGVSG